MLLRGRILDAETNEAIPGASLVMLTEDYSVSDFEWRQDQVYAIAPTDRNGQFQIERPLELTAPYSVIIAVSGYLPITVDGFAVNAETPNPLELTIYLTRG